MSVPSFSIRENETIYNLLPSIAPKDPSPLHYTSIRRPRIKKEYSEKNRKPLHQHKTMGVPKEEMPNPKDYLKMYSKCPKTIPLDKNKFSHPCSKISRIQDNSHVNVPPELPPIDVRNQPNLITKNAVDAITKSASIPPRIFCDTRNGNKVQLEPPRTHPGIEKRYVFKDEYGVVPKYIKRKKKAIEKAQTDLDLYMKEKRIQNSYRYLTQEKKQEMINGLKKNWDEIYRKYSCLPLILDTINSKRNKLQLEEDLDRLQTYIKLLENSSDIYITDC